jgi:hypothetical protein
MLRILAQTIWHGQESRPKYFSMGENLDHAQNMEANFSPKFGQTSGGDQNSRPYPILWDMEYGQKFLLPVEML